MLLTNRPTAASGLPANSISTGLDSGCAGEAVFSVGAVLGYAAIPGSLSGAQEPCHAACGDLSYAQK
jgi:hypothetical protein